MKCPKCQGEMEKGKYSIVRALNWLSEEETRGIIGVLKTSGYTNITAYKCKNCGYLESYAK